MQEFSLEFWDHSAEISLTQILREKTLYFDFVVDVEKSHNFLKLTDLISREFLEAENILNFHTVMEMSYDF